MGDPAISTAQAACALESERRQRRAPVTSAPERLDLYVTGAYASEESNWTPAPLRSWVWLNQAGFTIVGWGYFELYVPRSETDETRESDYERIIRYGSFNATFKHRESDGSLVFETRAEDSADPNGTAFKIWLSFERNVSANTIALGVAISEASGSGPPATMYSCVRLRGEPTLPDEVLDKIDPKYREMMRALARAPLSNSQIAKIRAFPGGALADKIRNAPDGPGAGLGYEVAVRGIKVEIATFINRFPYFQRVIVGPLILMRLFVIDGGALYHKLIVMNQIDPNGLRRAAEMLGIHASPPTSGSARGHIYRYSISGLSLSTPTLIIGGGVKVGTIWIQRGQTTTDGFVVERDWHYHLVGWNVSAGWSLIPFQGEHSPWSEVETTDDWIYEDFFGTMYVADCAANIAAGVSYGEVGFLGSGRFTPLVSAPSVQVGYATNVGASCGYQFLHLMPDRGADPNLGIHVLPRRQETDAAASEGTVVGFASDQHELSNEAKVALRLVCARYRYFLERSATCVKIEGHASRLDTEEHNRALSQRRSDSVERYMREVLNDCPGTAESASSGAGERGRSTSRLFAHVHAQGLGESSAAGRNVPEGDDTPSDRIVIIWINGVVVLSLLAQARTP